MPTVVGEAGGVTIERWQIGFVERHGERQPSRRVERAKQRIGKAGAGLGAAIPGLHNARHAGRPLGGDHCATGLDDNDGSLVGSSNGADEFDIVG